MKSLLIIVCVLLVDYSMCINKRTVKLPPEATSVVLVAVQQCITETGVLLEALLQVYQGGYTEDKKFKEFIHCAYKNAGYLNQDGRINTEKLSKLFKNDQELVESIRRCAEAPGRNSREAVFNFFKCFQDTVPVKFVI